MLPKLEHPIFETTIPSTKKKIKFRPMLVKEEKILLMAKEGRNPTEILLAVRQVVNNCIANADFDIDSLTTFDLEFMFTRIRALSVESKIQLQYEDVDDKKVRNFEIDLEKIEVKFPENIDTVIKVSGDVSIQLKYPTIDLYANKDFQNATEAALFDELVMACLDKYFEGDKIHKFKDSSKEEIKNFVDNMDIKTYTKIEEFLNTLPSLYHKIEYTNNNGDKRSIVLDSLNDFFSFT